MAGSCLEYTRIYVTVYDLYTRWLFNWRGVSILMQILWIGFGSAIGGSIRYLLDISYLQLGWSNFPVMTLCINISGSFLLGYLTGLWSGLRDKEINPLTQHFWITGFCGGYTTFSAFSWQVLTLLQDVGGLQAGIYAAASVGFGFLAVWVGLSIGSRGNEFT
ncbi:MAG: hypothetical protein CNC89_02975 [Puniceicoccaceae bacterium MED-G31]|nr:MAG: hypothetical protein CNC89_02975 [Puniceicoccaceae bacterium MED-G31]